MKQKLRGSIFLLTLLLGLVIPARAESDLDFTLVNKTGYNIKEVYVGPTISRSGVPTSLKKSSRMAWPSN